MADSTPKRSSPAKPKAAAAAAKKPKAVAAKKPKAVQPAAEPAAQPAVKPAAQPAAQSAVKPPNRKRAARKPAKDKASSPAFAIGSDPKAAVTPGPAAAPLGTGRDRDDEDDSGLDDTIKTLAPAPKSGRHLKGEEKNIREFAVNAARMLDDSHCSHVLLLDVRGKSDLTDYILLASGTSDRQIRSVADEVTALGRESGMTRMGTEQDGPAQWVVVDFVDVIVHLFEPTTRSHYDIEMLWGEVPRIAWQRRKVKTK
jgi:ribosome-associated protein